MLTTVRDVGGAVRHARRRADLSQDALAELAHVSRPWLSRLETGSNPRAELRKVLDVFAALGLALDLASGQQPTSNDDDPFDDMFGSQP